MKTASEIPAVCVCVCMTLLSVLGFLGYIGSQGPEFLSWLLNATSAKALKNVCCYLRISCTQVTQDSSLNHFASQHGLS